MLVEHVQDYVLAWSKDTLQEPPRTPAPVIPYRGVLARPDLRTPVATTSRAIQTDGAEPGSSPFSSLPLEVVSAIIEEAALAHMVDDREGTVTLTVDCLRPEASWGDTLDRRSYLGKRFNSVCKSCASVCRLFHALVVPLIWRDPFFTRGATGFSIFLDLLPKTSLVAFPPSLAPAQPFQTYVRVFSPLNSSIFCDSPSLLLKCLPLLTRLTTIRFGFFIGSAPLSVLRQMALVMPPSVKSLPDVFLNSTEKSDRAVDRLSAFLSLASRCESLQDVDITWGQAVGKQLDHILFVLKLQGLQRSVAAQGVEMRGASLRLLALNDQCEVSVGFLETLPEVAPFLASFHLEVGVKLIQGSNSRKSINVESFVGRLPYLESFSWTATPQDVVVVGKLNNLLVTHPRMKALQLFIFDFSTAFIVSLATSPVPLPLRCFCISPAHNDLVNLLCLRRPWKLRRMASLVLEYGELMGGYTTLDDQTKADVWRKADAMTVIRGGAWINS